MIQYDCYHNKGFTIPEAILSILIMVVSLFGLLNAFAFSTEYIEKIGLRRQALGVVQAEYEKMRKYSHNGSFDLSDRVVTDQPVFLKSSLDEEEHLVEGLLSTTVLSESGESSLECQSFRITLVYEYEKKLDTVSLPGRLYRD